MTLTIEEAHVGEVTVLAPAGRLDTTTAGELERRMGAAIDGGARKLLLDLADAPYVSSHGLRVLLKASKRLTELGGAFAICAMTEQVADVFSVTGFDRIIAVRRDRAEGLADL
jgi:anti-anti-sigma factor